MRSNTIDIAGLDKAEVLAALYNASRPQGMGFLHYTPDPMSKEEAAALLKQTTYFDYLKGRVMKIEIGDTLDPWGYDRDNGAGAVESVIETLRSSHNVNAPEIQAQHFVNRSVAAEQARQAIATTSSVHVENGFSVVTIGLSDVAGPLSKAIYEASK